MGNAQTAWEINTDKKIDNFRYYNTHPKEREALNLIDISTYDGFINALSYMLEDAEDYKMIGNWHYLGHHSQDLYSFLIDVEIEGKAYIILVLADLKEDEVQKKVFVTEEVASIVCKEERNIISLTIMKDLKRCEHHSYHKEADWYTSVIQFNKGIDVMRIEFE